MRLLVTRPEPDAERTAATLRARGHEPLIGSLLRIEAVGVEIGEGPFAAVLMTSANAARAIATHPERPRLVRLPALVVGERSALAAREAGFVDVESAGGNAADLTRLAARRFGGHGARLIYLCGWDRSVDLAGDLAHEGIEVQGVEIYRAITAERLPCGIEAALRAGQLDGVLHFSERSARAYLAAAERAGCLEAALRPTQYCLSAQVAAPLKKAGSARLRVAERPDEPALLALTDQGGGGIPV